jgi:hypothetical protein
MEALYTGLGVAAIVTALAVFVNGWPDINIGNKTTNNYYDGEERDD